MSSLPVTPAGKRILSRLAASRIDLESTRGRISYWVEGLLRQLGLDGVERLMGLLVSRARSQRNPSAWFNWAAARPWQAVIDDSDIRFVHSGPPQPARREQDCGVASVGTLILAALG